MIIYSSFGIFFFELFSFFNHILNFVFGKSSGRLNSDITNFSSSFIFSGNIYNTVGINIESYFNLRYSSKMNKN